MQRSDVNHYLLLDNILQTHRKSYFYGYQSFEVRLHSTSTISIIENEEENEILKDTVQKSGVLVSYDQISLKNLVLHKKLNANNDHRQSLTILLYGHCQDTFHQLQSYHLPQSTLLKDTFHLSMSQQVLKSTDQHSELTLKVLTSFIPLSDSQISILIDQSTLQSKDTTDFMSTVGSSYISSNKSSQIHRNNYSPSKPRVKFVRTYSQLYKTTRETQEDNQSLRQCARKFKQKSEGMKPVRVKKLKLKRSFLRAQSFQIETEVVDVHISQLSKKADLLMMMLVLSLQLLILLHLLHPSSKV